jgi:hypothetical protein
MRQTSDLAEAKKHSSNDIKSPLLGKFSRQCMLTLEAQETHQKRIPTGID